MTISALLLALISIFVTAKLFGELAERIGQPAVLGEMLGGIAIGASGLQLIDAHDPVLHLLAELGVVLLLFLIGLETDINRLLSVGVPSFAVAIAGVAIPFAAGYGIAVALHYPTSVAIFLGATLTATSVGITARVLSDLGHLKSDESQVILGAAVVDDILGLILLTIVSAIAAGERITAFDAGRTTVIAFGFVALALAVGSVLAPRLVALIERLRVAKALFFASITFAFALAYVAGIAGSALIIGAFTAGLVLAKTRRGRQIERQVHDVAQFFIPIFFVTVGAAVDLRSMTSPYVVVGVLLTIVAVAGKVAAGYAAFGRPLRKIVIGVGMIPRGEVGLIFAQVGLSAGILSAGLYSSVAMVMVVTTLIAPPLLRLLLKKRDRDDDDSTIGVVVNEALSDS